MPSLKSRIFKLFTIFFLCSCFCGYGQPSKNREEQLKAAFLFHFTQFVEWPETALPADNSPLIIGVLGKSPFDAFLIGVISDETVKGHPVEVRYYKDVSEIKACHLLYINLPGDMTKKALQQLRSRPVLTVSDKKGFLKAGGMIRLFSENNKVRFRINPSAAEAEHLALSSKLLNLAEIYTPKDEK
jgi:hypothetical protein